MSGEGVLFGPRWPATAREPRAPSPFDICTCGDYRRDHEGGTGPCTLAPDPVPEFTPCRRFRMALASQAGVRA